MGSARTSSAGGERRPDAPCAARLVAACALATLSPACATPTNDTPEPLPAPAIDDEAPIVPIPAEVDVDAAAAALGARLFHDPEVSHDAAVACVTCHDITTGGDADTPRTALPGREPGPINVPTVLNARYQFRWAWSGRFESLEAMITQAMRAPHAMATEVDEAVSRLAPAYGADFRRAYPHEGLTARTFVHALTQYVSSLVTPGSPFDRYLLGDEGALDDDALGGWNAFRDYGCVSCHQGRNVGGNLFQRFGVMEDYFARRSTITPADLGRFVVTEDEADRHVFRVPSLRNVALTAPYFHDGSAATLEEAVQVMARYQLGRVLGPDDTRRIVAFLRSLTGELPAGVAP